MNGDHARRDLLMRFLDGRTSPDETRQVQERLLTDPQAREFLREVAEQAVLIADLERASPSDQNLGIASRADGSRPRGPGRRRRLAMTAAAAVLAISAFSAYSLVTAKASVARIVRATGSNLHFDSSGRTELSPMGGTPLAAGDTLESRSCDSWVALDLGGGATLTIAGNSAIRVLSSRADEKRFELLNGSLWSSPGPRPSRLVVIVQLPTATVEARGALLDVQTSASESVVRVHGGSARVTRRLDGLAVEVPPDHQVAVSLDGEASPAVIPQPRPVDAWSRRLLGGDEVSFGRWLPPTESLPARLRAAPLLWPIPGRDPLLLHAVAVAAWKTSDRPVRLGARARLRLGGSTRHAQTVRFGFSTQKMRGVFAGKFEVDVPSGRLGPPGTAWEVELPLSSFRPLHPHLATSPDGLELTDVYALTIVEDAGLEVYHVELLPADPSLAKDEGARTSASR